MKLNYIITKLQASIERKQEEFLHNYSTLTDDTKVWCMIDLANSSNYRLLNGPKLGYVRGETFFTLIKNVVSSSNQVRLIKEIGDAVLLASDNIRPLIESVILINQISLNLKSTQPTEMYPFEIRCGFSYGISKKLIRPNEDFLGSTIDQLARIMSVRSITSNICIQEEAHNHFQAILKEYNSFLIISEPKKLLPKDAKNMIQDIVYREIIIDWENLLKFNDHFVDWRK
jgi:hypothetical protein